MGDGLMAGDSILYRKTERGERWSLIVRGRPIVFIRNQPENKIKTWEDYKLFSAAEQKNLLSKIAEFNRKNQIPE